jgi:hypothetical protein
MPRKGRAAVVALAVLGAAACTQPTAEVTIAWVPGRVDADGNRTLQVYEDGERFSVLIEPNIPESGTDLLSMDVDSRGEGVVLSDRAVSHYVHLGDGRTPRLSPVSAGGGELAIGFQIARNADAIVRGFERQSVAALAMMPIRGPHMGETTVIATPDHDTPPVVGAWRLATASDAPVAFWVERVGVPARPSGWVEVFAYPSDLPGPWPSVSEPTILATNRIQGRVFNPGADPRRASDAWCRDRACVSPDGRSLTVQGQSPCTLQWWSWRDELVPVKDVALDDGCEPSTDPALFAQVEHDVVLLDDAARIYVADLSTGEVHAGPKIWGESTASIGPPRFSMHPIDRGHGMLFVSHDIKVVRADARGVRVVSAEGQPCVGAAQTVASPSGGWVVSTCLLASFDPSDVVQSTGAPPQSHLSNVVRVSSLGLEVFSGIAMAPLAVDDDGNALLYSFDQSGAEPRGLFVLTVDGQVARVDDLEPEPVRVANGTLDLRFFATGNLQP